MRIRLAKISILFAIIAGAGAARAQETPTLGPTIQKGGTSTATTTMGGNGLGLELAGGTEAGAYLVARYDVPPRTGEVTAGFTVMPQAGASFAFDLRGSGPRPFIRLERVPGSDELLATTPAGEVDCGPVGSGDSTSISLVVHDSLPATFDVLLDGAASRCTRLPTQIQPPFTGFIVEDEAGEGYGGAVQFSEMTLD